LLADIEDGRREEIDELWDSSRIDDDLSVLRGPRSNVGQSPSSLELQRMREPLTPVSKK
jgi:hypothetical protein